MPSKVMKPLGANNIGQSASSERGNVPKTMSKLFLEAVKHHGRKVTEKNIYDYFQENNIHLTDHLLNMPVMTRSGAVYRVFEFQSDKCEVASDGKEKPKKSANKMKVDKNYADESPVRSIQDEKTSRELKIKSKRASAKQNNAAQPNSSENVYESRNSPRTIISDPQEKLKKAVKRKINEDKYCEESAVQSIPGGKSSPQLKENAKRSKKKQKDFVQLHSLVRVDEICNSPQTITSDPQKKVKIAVKRKINDDKYCEESAVQSIPDVKSSSQLKGKAKRSKTRQKDVVQLHSPVGVDEMYNNLQIVTSDPQVKLKKSVKKRKIGADNYDEKSVTRRYANEKSFSKLKGKTKRSTAKRTDVAQLVSSGNGEKCFDNPRAIISDPQVKPKKAAARKAIDTNNSNTEAAGLSPSHEKNLSQLKRKAQRSPVERKDVSERYSPHSAYGNIDSGQGITYPNVKIEKAAKRKATDSENDNNAIQICSNNPKCSTKRSKQITEK